MQAYADDDDEDDDEDEDDEEEYYEANEEDDDDDADSEVAVVYYDSARGFGFLQDDSYEDQFFFHISEVECATLRQYLTVYGEPSEENPSPTVLCRYTWNEGRNAWNAISLRSPEQNQ